MGAFRKLTRWKQALSREECLSILTAEKRGVLAVQGEEGYPYALPINHWYDPDSGKLYFHSGKFGHKIDALARCDKVSYCVIDGGTPNPGNWWLDFRSVIVFGRLTPVEDHQKALDISRQLSYKFTRDEDYINHEIEHSGPGVAVYGLEIESITGKLVHER